MFTRTRNATLPLISLLLVACGSGAGDGTLDYDLQDLSKAKG